MNPSLRRLNLATGIQILAIVVINTMAGHLLSLTQLFLVIVASWLVAVGLVAP